MEWDMELRQLRYLRAISKRGSVTAAAEAEGVAQPAVTKQMQRLERELGVTLFDRSSRGATLTAEGDVVARATERVLGLLADLQAELADRAGLARGHLRLCATETIMEYLLPTALAALHRRYASLEVSAEMLGTDDAVALLLDRQVDVAIVTLPLNHADLEVSPLYSEDIVLLMPAGDPLAGRTSVALNELANRELLLSMPGHGLRAVIDAACRRAGFTTHPILELRSQEALIRLVEQGAGLTFAPKLCVQRPRPAVHVCAIRPPTLRRGIGWARLRDRYVPRAVEEFVRELAAAAARVT
jgi:LysR family transcriptional regulator, cyn operon transcriptional activator